MNTKLPLLVLVPHASGHVPADILKQMLGEHFYDESARQALKQHIFNDGDPFTDLIYQLDNTPHYLEALVSRFVVDVNRIRDDNSPNGVVKLTDFSETSLYPEDYTLSSYERERRLKLYHDSFHKEIDTILSQNDVKLMISGHSMATFGPNLGPDKGKARPAITLMTGGDTNGDSVEGQRNFLGGEKARAVKALAEKHFADIIAKSDVPNLVTLNDPWSADTLSNTYTNPELDYSLPCFGIELNHALFMDEHKQAIPNNLKLLNQSFTNFASDCLELFE